jgi:two-component system cell cycle response regulator DivK
MPGKLILVIEDDELQRRLFSDILTARGYGVAIAVTGALGIELAFDQQPDLILLDLRLPDVSGFEVAEVLKSSAKTVNIPIMAVAACGQPQNETRAREHGCDAYHSKPVALRDLLLHIERLLWRPNLPAPGFGVSWTARTRAALVIAVRDGTITRREARDRYDVSEGQLQRWERIFDMKGVSGLHKSD